MKTYQIPYMPILLCIIFGLLIFMFPDIALAQAKKTGTADITAVLESAADFLTGNFGKGAAGLAIIVLGFLTLSGNLQLRTGVMILSGIVLIFMAGAVVKVFLG